MENKEPVRIAQILNKMDSGGIESVVMNYYRNINRDKIQFDFYFAEDSNFPQKEELESLGAGIYPVPAYTKVFQYQKVLYKAFTERKYKIVHAHLNTMSVFPLFAAWRGKVPVRICHNHTTAHWGEGKRTILKYILRPFARVFATDYFACGETAGRWMYGNRCFNKGRVKILNNAIDVEKFAFDKDARISLRKELGIAENDFVAGHVGRFMYQKNHRFLINIFAKLKSVKDNAKLLLIGEGELENEIKQLVKELGLEHDVIFTGSRKDVNKLYSVMDVFCLPSFYEGLPVVAIEAQANGLPCFFSQEITKAACLTSLAKTLSIEGSPDLWASDMAAAERHNEKIPEDYNIKETANALAEFYLNKK